MDKDKLDKLMEGIGRLRRDYYALWVLIFEQGAVVNLETGQIRWPPHYK